MPADVGGIGRPERAAFACRVARLAKADRLAAHYAAMLADAGEESLVAIADLAAPPESGRLGAIVRHVDLLAVDPGRATRADVEALRSAGLTDRDIVALAGLVAFVSYQIRRRRGPADAGAVLMGDAVHDFTLEALEWYPYLQPIALDAATPEQLAASCTTTPSNTKVSAYVLTLAPARNCSLRARPLQRHYVCARRPCAGRARRAWRARRLDRQPLR